MGIYVFAIFFTNLSSDFVKLKNNDTQALVVAEHFGSLWLTLFTLFHSMLNGISWEDTHRADDHPRLDRPCLGIRFHGLPVVHHAGSAEHHHRCLRGQRRRDGEDTARVPGRNSAIGLHMTDCLAPRPSSPRLITCWAAKDSCSPFGRGPAHSLRGRRPPVSLTNLR